MEISEALVLKNTCHGNDQRLKLDSSPCGHAAGLQICSTSDALCSPTLIPERPGLLSCSIKISDGDTGINCSPFSPSPRHLSDSLIIDRELAGLGYLPAGLRVSVVAEILRYPVVDGGQSHFGLLAGLHGHADERGVGIGRFDFRVGFVVDLHRRAGLDGDLWVAVPWMRAAGEPRCCGGVAAGGNGAPEVRRHPGGGGVPGRRAGRRVGATSGEAEPLEEEVLLGGRASRSSSVVSLRVRAEDGEILEPVEAGEAVVHGGRVGPDDLLLRVNRLPFLLTLVGDVGARQNRHPGFVRAVRAEDDQKIFRWAFKVLFYLEVKEKKVNIKTLLIKMNYPGVK